MYTNVEAGTQKSFSSNLGKNLKVSGLETVEAKDPHLSSISNMKDFVNMIFE